MRYVCFLAACVASFVACGTGAKPPPPPARYACPKVAIPAVNGGKPGGKCQSDADCTQKPDGRCVVVRASTHAPPEVDCLYDDCANDNDCPRGHVCECGTGQGPSRNRCVPGNCHTAFECEDRPCTDTMSTYVAGKSAQRRVEGHYCKTREDQCRVDRDCDLEGRSACVYRTELSRWTCVAITFGSGD